LRRREKHRGWPLHSRQSCIRTVFRLSREQIIGYTADKVYVPEAAKAVAQADHDAIVSPTSQTRTELSIDHHGDKRLIACNRMIARDEKGEPEFLVALFEDVTDRRSLSREVQSAKKFWKRSSTTSLFRSWSSG
jgi:hypothetical protein